MLPQDTAGCQYVQKLYPAAVCQWTSYLADDAQARKGGMPRGSNYWLWLMRWKVRAALRHHRKHELEQLDQDVPFSAPPRFFFRCGRGGSSEWARKGGMPRGSNYWLWLMRWKVRARPITIS